MIIISENKYSETVHDAVECIEYHEERWEDRVHQHGLDKLVMAHYDKFCKDYTVEADKEHALLELAAASLYTLSKMKKG